MNNAGFGCWLTRVVLAVFFFTFFAAPLRAAPTNAASTVTDQGSSPEILRVYLQVQEQLHATQLALERNRQDAETAARSTAETLTARIQSLEQSLAGERKREFEALQSLQRLVLIFAGVFASVGLLAIVITAYVQSRAMNRLVSLTASLTAPPALTHGTPFASLGPGAGPLVPLGATEGANARLLGVIERLERRIQELEQTAHTAGAPRPETAKVLTVEPTAGVSAEAQLQTAAERREAQIELLLGKGQVLLDLDRAEEALACFDDALKLDPHHAEALVRKGAALERARQPDEAIACYDRAIAVNRSFTMAYLHKGGLCNRLARHEEALRCYEEALRTQEQPHTAE